MDRDDRFLLTASLHTGLNCENFKRGANSRRGSESPETKSLFRRIFSSAPPRHFQLSSVGQRSYSR